MDDPVRLRAAIGARHWRVGLEFALADDPLVRLEFHNLTPIHHAFAPMVRDQRYDMSELAIVSAAQAVAYGKPIVVLPMTLAARFHHGSLVGLRGVAPAEPEDLRGARIAVRAYSQTTGVWVRGLLDEEAGLGAADIHWLTLEDAHVGEYADPPWCERVRGNHGLMDLLRTGGAAAAVFGNNLPPDADLVPVFNRPQDADRAWYNHNQLVPINHVLVVRRAIAQRHPEALRHLWEVLRAQRPLPSRGTIAADMAPFGISAMTRPVQRLLDLCAQQRLLPRALSVEELFADARALLGPAA